MFKANAEKNGSVNDRPLFMQQNGANRSFSAVDNVEVSNFRSALPQFIAVSIKNILLFGYGMTLGFPTIVIPAIQGGDGRDQSDIVLNKEQISWFSSINLICVPLGCLFSGVLTQPLGKRRAMQFVNLPILAAWLLFHFATSTEHLYAALCLAGLGGGLMEAPVLTYVAEITEPKYRGILSALGTTCVITGVFSQFILGSLMDWRSVAAVSAAFPVISIVALCFVPESPVWLIREERFHEAVKSLQWLRGWVPEHKIEDEFNQLYDELITQPQLEQAAENGGVVPKKTLLRRLHMFRKRSFLVPFMLVSFTFFTGHFSGKTPLQTYAVQIFHTLKAPMNKYHATILLGVAEMISTILGVILIHFTGKRPLVLVSTVGTGLCFFGTATYAYYLNDLPGFAVNNVVVNASAIVPKSDIITQANITKIFKDQMLQETTQLPSESESDRDLETTTMPNFLKHELEVEGERLNRLKRDGGDQQQLNFVGLDYVDHNETTPSSPSFELFDSEENDTTTLMPNDIGTSTKSLTTQANVLPPHEPQREREPEPVKEEVNEKPTLVVDELLLPVPKQEKNYLVWLPLILLLLSAFFSHLGIRMIPWILIGEVFPADIRNSASGFSGGLGYVFGFLANKLFLVMLSSLTLPGTFWFYSFVAFLGTVVLYFALPETEGRTLGEIEAHFSKKSEFNLFNKAKLADLKSKNNQKIMPAIQMDNLQNLHIPMNQQTEAKIIHLQQSDFGPQRTRDQREPQAQASSTLSRGETNLAFDENNTTHL